MGWQWHQLDHMQIICTSLQITALVPHQSVFTGWMPFLLPNQQRQSPEGKHPSNRTLSYLIFYLWLTYFWCRQHTHTHRTTTIVLQPFVQDYPGEPVPEETLTHPPSWSSSSLYQLLPFTMIHSILLVQITCLAIFLHNLFPCPLLYLLVWSPLPHIPYISSPNQCFRFAAHAHAIATCFAVVSILYHLFLVFLSTPYLELCLLP